MGFVVSLSAPLAAGATVVTLPHFALEAALAAIERHRVTVVAVPPPVMAALAHHRAVDRYDLSSLELIVSGGAPLAAPLQTAVAARFPHAAVAQGYGLTETAVAISGPVGRSATAPGSVGRPMLHTEVKLVAGEIWVRGPQVMTGYLNAPAENLTPDGWLRTGDAGRIDDHGNLQVRDRLKELIKVNGYQVAPAELEALLHGHPRVADVAVVRCADARTGEAPVAVVVPRGDLDSARAVRLGGRARSPAQARASGPSGGGDPAHAVRQDPAPRARGTALNSSHRPRSANFLRSAEPA